MQEYWSNMAGRKIKKSPGHKACMAETRSRWTVEKDCQWVSTSMATNSRAITHELPLIFFASPQKRLMTM